jgi:hypothetical protein
MKSIKTLIKDVEDVLRRNDGLVASDLSENIVREIGPRVYENFGPKESRGTLRLSQMGSRCPRSLWASVHSPSSQEAFTARAKLNFTYGHVIEALLISLAKVSGHEVTGEGDELYAYGVRGHRDCVIDGCVVDVKSTNSFGYKAFKSGDVSEDMFLRDYLDQLDGYLVGSASDDLVRVKDKAYIWACDKVLGHTCLYEHKFRPDRIKELIERNKAIVDSETPPPCECGTIQEKNGNVRLDIKASYNNYRYFCFPNLRTFIVKGKPVPYAVVKVWPAGGMEVDRNETA